VVGDWGQLGRSVTHEAGYDPLPRPVIELTNVVAIAAGVECTLAVTSNGQVYAWGDNSDGELGTNATNVASTNLPMVVAGISNVVLVSAQIASDGTFSAGIHSMAMTVDQGTNHYRGWGDNTFGQVGNGTNGDDSSAQFLLQYSPAQVQFCTRCQRTVQLGTNGTFTAQCNGTLKLYFNDSIGAFSDNAGSYTATVNGSNVTVMATNNLGVAVGAVTNGGFYSYSASGTCFHSTSPLSGSDANGNNTSNTAWNCSDFSIINKTNAVCPTAQCFSLVGRIQ